MKAYYIHVGGEQMGPMSLEELLKSGIQGDTQVWHSGLDTWTAAKNLEELKLMFAQKAPPQFASASIIPPAGPISYQPVVTKNKSGVRTFLRIIFSLFIIGVIALAIFIISNRNRGGSSSTAAYYQSKMSVGEYERTHPNEFLTAKGTYNETFFGNKMRIQGSVTNKATVTNFKDIVIEVRYYSGTKTLIKTEQFVMYEFVPAHSTKKFEWKITPPSGTETLGWDAVGGVWYI